MDEAQRVPIDLSGLPAEDHGSRVTRPSQAADGTWIIDILVPQPCDAVDAGEIVVCAPTQEAGRYPAAVKLAPDPTVSEQVIEALTVQIGPLEVRPIPGAMQVRVRF